MPHINKNLDGSLAVTADDGAKLTIAPGSSATQGTAVTTFLQAHAVAVVLPADDPLVVAALPNITLAKAVKALINRGVITLADLS